MYSKEHGEGGNRCPYVCGDNYLLFILAFIYNCSKDGG